MITMASAIGIFAVIPFGNQLTIPGTDWVVKLRIADVDIGLLYIFGLASLGRVWNYSGRRFLREINIGFTGSLRAAAQMISYEVALGLSVIGIIILSQSLRLTEIVNHQAGGFWNWNIWYQPVAFILYLICGVAELNRTPFDMPEAESELACGFNIEYSSMKFALFFMGEYAHMVTVAAVAVTLFLGGWQPPLPALGFVPGVVWFGIKVFILLFFFIWERGTFPRLRYDQIMKFGWKVHVSIGTDQSFDYRAGCCTEGMREKEVRCNDYSHAQRSGPHPEAVFLKADHDSISGREAPSGPAMEGNPVFRERRTGKDQMCCLRPLHGRLPFPVHLH